MNNNIDKLIRGRHSVRKYLDKEIEQDKIMEINKLISECNNNGDLHIQLITNNGDAFDKFRLHYGKLENAKNYLAMVGKKDKKLDEKIGYYGEHIVLKAQELGLNTCWVAGTYNKGAVVADINDGEKLVCVIAIGYGSSNGIERKSKSIDDVSKSFEYPHWYKKGIEYSLLAPTAINQQKFKFELHKNNVVEIKPGIGPLTKVDMGIVKYHFELGAGIDNFSWK